MGNLCNKQANKLDVALIENSRKGKLKKINEKIDEHKRMKFKKFLEKNNINRKYNTEKKAINKTLKKSKSNLNLNSEDDQVFSAMDSFEYRNIKDNKLCIYCLNNNDSKIYNEDSCPKKTTSCTSLIDEENNSKATKIKSKISSKCICNNFNTINNVNSQSDDIKKQLDFKEYNQIYEIYDDYCDNNSFINKKSQDQDQDLNNAEEENDSSVDEESILQDFIYDNYTKDQAILLEGIKLDHFCLITKIGKGSFGQVFKVKLKRDIYLKFLNNRLTKNSVREIIKAKLNKPEDILKLKDFIFNSNKISNTNKYGEQVFNSFSALNECILRNSFALKIINKEHIKEESLIENVKAERLTLSKLSHPFKVELFFSFQSENNLYLVTEYIPGGDLLSLILKFKRFNTQMTQFYLAELVLIIEHLHKNNIIYRDLKPENILLNADGHIKLCDFGLCKIFFDIQNKKDINQNERESLMAKSICGTAEYMAPEILDDETYSFTVDWYSLGVMAYYMISGVHPFNVKNKQSISHIQTKRELPNFNNGYFTSDLKDLIIKMLYFSPEFRLGYEQGSEEIKNHPFFKDMDWDKLYNKEIAAPYIPKIDLTEEYAYSFDILNEVIKNNEVYNENDYLHINGNVFKKPNNENKNNKNVRMLKMSYSSNNLVPKFNLINDKKIKQEFNKQESIVDITNTDYQQELHKQQQEQLQVSKNYFNQDKGYNFGNWLPDSTIAEKAETLSSIAIFNYEKKIKEKRRVRELARNKVIVEEKNEKDITLNVDKNNYKLKSVVVNKEQKVENKTINKLRYDKDFNNKQETQIKNKDNNAKRNENNNNNASNNKKKEQETYEGFTYIKEDLIVM